MTKRHAGALSVVVGVLVTTFVTHGQDNAADTSKLIEVLQLKPGSIVAEIGAGSGELTLAVARHVGPIGQVFTSELGADRIHRLRQAVDKGGTTNVHVVEGQESSANLDAACCDAVFMRNVYHHFAEPPVMNASFLSALKPGGRIAVIDFAPPSKASAAPDKRDADGSHGVTAQTVASELKAAGFEIVASEERARRWFIVVAAKPAT